MKVHDQPFEQTFSMHEQSNVSVLLCMLPDRVLD